MRKFLEHTIKGAGAILREGFRTNFEVQTKGASWNMVTEYDFRSDKFIIDAIKKKYPKHSVLTEESGNIGTSKNVWVIDPLDGTHAFVRGIPQFTISIAYVEKGVVKLGVVYDVAADELFIAEKGKGAYLNGNKIKVSDTDKIEQRTLACLMLGTKGTSVEEKAKIYNVTIKNKMWMPKVESMALCLAYVACGRYDFIVTKHLWPWDYTAGALLMQEAGAKVTQITGKPYTWKSDTVLAGNKKLYPKILELYKKL